MQSRASFAAASGELSRSVEVVVSRTLRADTNYPTLVPYPPRNHTSVTTVGEAQAGLARVGKLLLRIHWLMKNGTLPAEDREQVQRITSWSDMFYVRAGGPYGPELLLRHPISSVRLRPLPIPQSMYVSKTTSCTLRRRTNPPQFLRCIREEYRLKRVEHRLGMMASMVSACTRGHADFPR